MLSVSHKITIHCPIEVVFAYVKLLKNQDEFSVWRTLDPQCKAEYVGVDGTEGYCYCWDSEDRYIGAGSQVIEQIIENERIEMRYAFKRPVKSAGQSAITVRQVDMYQTEVTWTLQSLMKFPLNLFKRHFERRVHEDLVKSLENLKSKLESDV